MGYTKSRNRKRRRRFPAGIVLLAFLLLAILVGILIFALPGKTMLTYKILYTGLSAEGLLVRSESITALDEYEKIDYENMIDGQFVESGSKIATAYKKGYIKNTLSKLADTQESIVTYQNQNIIQNFDDRTIAKLDFEISVVIRKMAENTQGYIELYGELCRLVEERRSYVRENFNTDSNTYLQGLYSDEENLLESLRAWFDEFIAPADGYIGFYCDGFEGAMNAEQLASVKPAELKGYLQADYNKNINAFKLVTEPKWYVAIVTEQSSAFQQGMHYPVFIGNAEESEIGCLENIVTERNSSVLVFSFEKNVEKYLDIRTATIHIGERFAGYEVPSSYVKNGTITVKNQQDRQEIAVEVLYDNGETAILQETPALKVGQRIYE